MTMNKILAGIAFLMLAGCSATDRADPSSVKTSGFLGDYSQLAPGKKDQALLVYIDHAAPWRDYTKIRIEPVTFWAGNDTKVPAANQQALCDYAYAKLNEQLSKEFTVVDQAGPGVLVFRAAITDAEGATPGLRSISMVVPQARLLGAAKYAATGSYAFVGSAQSEGEVTDSVTGKRLAAWVDKRVGGGSVENAAVWKWGDAENIINYWAERVAQRAAELRAGPSG
jgi:Protein of unknown function (DUF3313)